MNDDLNVWRSGRVQAVVAERRGRLSLTYAADAHPISMSLPVRTSAHRDDSVRPWFRGLLPEGQIRLMMAYDAGVGADDVVGLLRVLGKDCAGALSLRPAGELPGDDDVGPQLDDGQIASLLRALPTSPMGFGEGFRVSLPGNQHKLLLTLDDAGWHRPDGAPSTHILKPPISALGASTVDNEAYCQWLARDAGLPAANTTIATFDGITVLVSERYDRARHDDGSTRRIHQEDACQALSIDPTRKYQTARGGPSLKAFAKQISVHGGELHALLRIATFTVIVGNADWHGKNVSVLIDDDGSVSVAPIYDAMSTRMYEKTATGDEVVRTLGMHIGGETDIDAVRLRHLVDEARSWGMSPGRAQRVVIEAVDGLRAALDSVAAPIDDLKRLVARRIDIVAARSREAPLRHHVDE
ncbi:MAG TPA: HipA domain-containing protein [Ilumatobacter sp.]|nr:HipA domain-containing protein [Ilumatobacter sp.]